MVEGVIGSALFDIRAGTAGFLSDISGAVGKAEGMFSGMGSNMSSKMQGVGGIMTAGITAPILAIGAFSIDAAMKVDGAMNTMIRKTGESGAAADKTKESFKNVFGTVPEDAKVVSDAMADVKTRLGLTGTELEGVTKKGIELARMLGTDVNTTIESSAKVFEAWHTPANQMSGDLDKFYVIATKTGVPLNELTGALTKVGAVATAAGVPMDSVTAAVGSLAAGGIPARQGVSIITEAITKMQDAGLNAGTELPAMLKRIADGHATDADKALLGSKNYDKLTGSLKDNKNGYDALLTAQKNSSGAIDKQADDTISFSDKLKMFKNDLMLAFEPLGKVLIRVFSNVLQTVQPILPVLTGIGNVFSHMPGPVQLIVVAILGILAAIGPLLIILPSLMGGFTILSGIISGPLLAGAIAFIAPFLPFIIILAAVGIALYLLYTYFQPFHDAVDQVLGWVKTLLGDLMSGDIGKFGEDFKNGIMAALDAIVHFDWGGFAANVSGAVMNAISGALGSVAGGAVDAARRALGLAGGAKIGHRPGGMLAVIGEGTEDEYVIPESKMGDYGAIASMPTLAGGGVISGGVVSALGSSSSKNTQTGDINFTAVFHNATLTSTDEADKLGRRMAYTANEYLRRSGHSRG